MDNIRICVVGLGYVGLPLALEMAKYFPTYGFDIKKKRIEELKAGRDSTGETSSEDLQKTSLQFTDDPTVISDSNFIIVAVPTSIDIHKIPDLTPLYRSSETVGKYLSKGSIVVYESTVYPGVTEDECIPVLEKYSQMKWKKDFFVGYSPERINPGDKVHTFTNIVKVVSGDTPETLEKVAFVYGKAVKAGIHKASSIKVAEAAKVIENTQRDINIALMNELKIIFDKMGISTKEVLEAASTKWNFLKFEPGLVGGHCIGVDPYYLAFKAEEIGHHPQIIMAGRRINDAMGRYFARELVKKMINQKINLNGNKVLICGITFKENVSDIRNTKVIDIISELNQFGIFPEVWDPVADKEEVKEEYNIELIENPLEKHYDALLLAVKHKEFLKIGRKGLQKYLKDNGILFDIKEVLEAFPEFSKYVEWVPVNLRRIYESDIYSALMNLSGIPVAREGRLV
ncbi:MAG: nucleotide sugar dehydrogenase, partial [Chitinispirillaceae bacterium]|nr:nucleotide sugar dehydrogenase [Chitinispirillaceae bacterium]